MKFFLALVSMISLTLVTPRDGLVDSKKEEGQGICDDGQYMIDKDLGRESNWLCQGDEIVIETFYEPAGQTECSNTTLTSTAKCMDVDIHYDDTPPTSGDYRHQAPKYGEYKYLPPQRWLHALQRGAVAFLYHPCAPVDEVTSLRELARSCLWRHVITPYPHLTKEKPLALVSWGCVYRMSWVSLPEAKKWIKDHALQTSGSVRDGHYNEGLLQAAELVSGPHDDDICPDKTSSPVTPSHTDTDTTIHTQPEATESSGGSGYGQQQQEQLTQSDDTKSCETNCTHGTSQIVVVVVNHHPTLIVLIVLTSVILLLASMITAWKIYKAWCKKERRRKARYKSVSKFFPFSYEKDDPNGVAIPEFGLPKTLPAEREMLLNDSDEDEL